MTHKAEIAALGGTIIVEIHRPVYRDADDPWEDVVADIPGAALAAQRDEDLAAAIVDAHRPPLLFSLGAPRYRGSTHDPATGATIVTYAVPFEGDIGVLTQADGSPDAPEHALHVGIDGRDIVLSYRLAQGVAGAAAKVAERFEGDHQRLLTAVGRRVKRADDARATLRAHIMRLLMERRAREQGERSLDQELQARLDEYLRR